MPTIDIDLSKLDLPTIEAMHDTLLDCDVLGSNHPIMIRGEKLIRYLNELLFIHTDFVGNKFIRGD